MDTWDDMRLYTLDSWEYIETPDESMWMKPNGCIQTIQTIQTHTTTQWFDKLSSFFLQVVVLLGL